MDATTERHRSMEWAHVTYGAYARRAAGPRAVLAAWQLALPPDAAFTHLTGAALHGWWLPQLPAGTPIFVQAPRRRRIRRDGMCVLRVDSSRAPAICEGLRVAAVEDVLLACARDLGLLDLAVVVDGALRAGVSRAQVEEAARERRVGAPALRRALAHADARAESPWETLLRLQHETFAVPVVPQHRIEDDGIFVARADLWIRGTRTLQEYDGEVHRDPAQHRVDLDRDRRLGRAGWIRNGFTSRDLTKRPTVVLRTADRALGRTTDLRRLEPWYDLLHDSTLTEVGGQRLRERWTPSKPAKRAASGHR